MVLKLIMELLDPALVLNRYEGLNSNTKTG